MMQDVGRVYVRTINLLHGRSGTLWDGRFKSSLIDSESYLLYCHRYIELNPVRAGMVTRPEHYPWSSHEHYALTGTNPLIAEHGIYTGLAEDTARRRKVFAALFETALAADVVQDIREAANANAALGSEAFVSRVSSLAGREAGIPRRGRPPRKIASGGKAGGYR